MSQYVEYEITDKTGEVSAFRVHLEAFTALNFTANAASVEGLEDLIDPLVMGLITGRTVTVVESMLTYPDHRPASENAQRENQAIVMGHDGTTFEPCRITIPTPTPTTMNPDWPGFYYREKVDGTPDDSNNAVWDALVTAIEANCKGPGGGAFLVDSIQDAGANL